MCECIEIKNIENRQLSYLFYGSQLLNTIKFYLIVVCRMPSVQENMGVWVIQL